MVTYVLPIDNSQPHIFVLVTLADGAGERETGVRAIVYPPKRTNPPTGCF